MLRLLALVQKSRGRAPSQRFRLEQWDRHLRASHDIVVELMPFESDGLTEILYQPGHRVKKAGWVAWDFVRRARALVDARNYDGVVVLREAALLGPAIYESILAWEGIPIIYDFDDAIWTTSRDADTDVNALFSWLHFRQKTVRITRLASVVTVGNAFLANWAKAYNPNVWVVPTSIDLDVFDVQPVLAQESPFVIAWSGTFSTLKNLESVRAAIERFARDRVVKVNVICDRPLARPFAHAETTFIPWSANSEAAEIGKAHVGIMPLPDEEFMRGKCGCKALQYMAAGRPAIVSPVGVNTDIVTHEVNGLLATTTDQWIEAFERVASSRTLRNRLAAAGRLTVEERFSASQSASRFAEAVNSVLVGKPRSRAATAAYHRRAFGPDQT